MSDWSKIHQNNACIRNSSRGLIYQTQLRSCLCFDSRCGVCTGEHELCDCKHILATLPSFYYCIYTVSHGGREAGASPGWHWAERRGTSWAGIYRRPSSETNNHSPSTWRNPIQGTEGTCKPCKETKTFNLVAMPSFKNRAISRVVRLTTNMSLLTIKNFSKSWTWNADRL